MKLQEKIDKYLRVKSYRKPKTRDYFHASEIGKTKKQIAQNLTNPSFYVSPQLQRIFDNGNDMHDRYTDYFKTMGILIADEIDAIGEEYLHGRLDCLIEVEGVKQIVELKSCNDRIFKSLDVPLREHNLQVQFYMYYMKVNKGILLYENKNTQAIKIFDVELDKKFVEDYILKLKMLLKEILAGIPQENEYL